MPSTEELDAWFANQKALAEIHAQEEYLAKKKRKRKGGKLKPAINPKHIYSHPSRQEKKQWAYEEKRVLGEQKHYTHEAPACSMFRSGEGRKLVDEHLIVSYQHHKPHSTLVCEDAGEVSRGLIHGCEHGRPYAILESAPNMKDHGLEFQDVAKAERFEVDNYCTIDADSRFMACANVRSRIDPKTAIGENMRMEQLVKDKRIMHRDEYEYRKRRLMDQYGIAVCELRL